MRGAFGFTDGLHTRGVCLPLKLKVNWVPPTVGEQVRFQIQLSPKRGQCGPLESKKKFPFSNWNDVAWLIVENVDEAIQNQKEIHPSGL